MLAALLAVLTLTSPDIAPGARIARAQVWNRDGCTGENRSPALSWSGAPAGTKSFALTIFDPDAPTGHGWWHWIAYDIPAARRSLPAGAASDAPGLRQARNDYGTAGYGGPCPPPGSTHHYVITLTALDVPTLHRTEGADSATAAAEIARHALSKARITATYGR